ncbi:MAG: glycosyltransferase family A protein, partial [SAR324 cluster bacterium]|nr:glycosyltransferase family A protein [SAR324 cluster bacterium]
MLAPTTVDSLVLRLSVPTSLPPDFLVSSPDSLSVVVPSYNSSSLLKNCLQALELQTAPKSSFEVIVVNDGSTD